MGIKKSPIKTIPYLNRKRNGIKNPSEDLLISNGLYIYCVIKNVNVYLN